MAGNNPFALFETDEALEKTQGIRIDYGAFYFQIGRMDVPGTPFAAYMREQMRPYDRAIALGQMDDKVSEGIMLGGFSKFMVFGWGSKEHGDGFMVGRDGSPIPFSAENVAALLRDLPQLFMDLLNQSRSFTHFRKAGLDADAGN